MHEPAAFAGCVWRHVLGALHVRTGIDIAVFSGKNWSKFFCLDDCPDVKEQVGRGDVGLVELTTRRAVCLLLAQCYPLDYLYF
jgi:hypothetical protein